MQDVQGSSRHLSLIFSMEKDLGKCMGVGGSGTKSRANAIPSRYWNPSVLPKAAKMRKAVTHLLETASVAVLRNQSELQDKAKEKEAKAWAVFSNHVFLTRMVWQFQYLDKILHWHWCDCPSWLTGAVPILISRSTGSNCLHLLPPLPEVRFKFRSAISKKTIKIEAVRQLRLPGKLSTIMTHNCEWSFQPKWRQLLNSGFTHK